MVLYAATIAGMSLVAVAMRTRAERAGLLVDEAMTHSLWQSLATPAVFLAAIPIAIATTYAATYFWGLLLVIGVVMRRRRG